MALNAMQSRRSGVTYGKKAAKPHKLSPTAFESLLKHSPGKPQSTLSRIQSTIKPSHSHLARPSNEQVFDVPLSESEDELSLIPHIKQGAHSQRHSPIRSWSFQVHKPREDVVNISDNAKKRKRVASNSTNALPRRSPPVPLPSKVFVDDNLPRRRRKLSTSQYEVPSDTIDTTHSLESNHIAKTERCDVSLHSIDLGHESSDDELMRHESILLDEMLLDDKDTAKGSGTLRTFSPSFKNPKAKRRPKLDSAPTTPPHTIKRHDSSSPHTIVMTTPRQRKLWTDLLHERQATPCPNIQQLEIKTQSKVDGRREASRSAPKCRLIDTLRSSDTHIEDFERSESDEDGQENRTSCPDQREDLQCGGFDPPVKQSSASTTSQPHPRPTKITYAQQRSYLSEPSQGLDELLTQSLGDGAIPALAKASNHSKANSLESRNVNTESEDTTNESMKSIHELRLAGNSRRFDDEMSIIIDDISAAQKSALPMRRAAFMDLARKLCDSSFKGRFTQGDYESKVFGVCGEERDPVCGIAIANAIAVILKEPSDQRSANHLGATGVLRCLSYMVSLTQDIRQLIKDRKMNMSRVAQQDVNEFVSSIHASHNLSFPPKISISPQAAALQAIELLLRRQREAGNVDNPLEPATISNIVTMIADTSTSLLGKLAEEIDDATRSKLKIALSILESLTVSPSCATDELLWPKQLIQKIVQAGKTILLADLGDVNLDLLIIRLYLNLSNNSKPNSAIFRDNDLLLHLMSIAQSRFHSLKTLINEEDHAAEFDKLVLALGTLFNLSEMHAGIRNILATLNSNIMKDLILLFSEHSGKSKDAESLAESQANVAFGYLAVLLGVICQDSVGYERVRKALPKHDANLLVGAIEEFTTYHKRVDREGSNEAWTGFTERLQSVADSLKAVMMHEGRVRK